MIKRRPARIMGFTLVEVMIVVAIIGILFTIAFPSYQKQVRKGARAQAKAVMLDIAQKEERFFTTNGAYCTSTATCAWLVNPSDLTKHAVAVNAPGADSPYDVVATPTSDYPDPDCGALTLTAMNVKKSDTGDAICW